MKISLPGTGIVLLVLACAKPAFALIDVEPSLVIAATTTIAAMGDRRYIFGRTRKHVAVWDALTGERIAEAVGEGGAIEPNTELAILGTEIWDLRHRHLLVESRLSEKKAVACGLTPDGHFAVIGAPVIQVWNLRTKSMIGSTTTEMDDPSFLAVSDAGDFLAVGRGATFEVYRTADGLPVKSGALAAVWPFRSKPHKGFSEIVDDRSMEFTVVYEKAGRDGGTRQRALWRIDWETDNINLFSDRLPRIGLTARARGNEVDVSWTIEGSSQTMLIGHEAPVSRIAFSPDRWTIATADKSGDVRSWDARSGELRHRFRGGTGEIVSLSFSPDAQFLLAASRNEMRVYPTSP